MVSTMKPVTLDGQYGPTGCGRAERKRERVCSKDHNRWFFAGSFRKVAKYSDPSDGRILLFWRSFGFRSNGVEGGLNSHGMKKLYVRPSFFLSFFLSVRPSVSPSVHSSFFPSLTSPSSLAPFFVSLIYLYFFNFFFGQPHDWPTQYV